MTCGYLRHHIDVEGYRLTLERIINSLKDVDFDTIVVTGVSGLLFGPATAHAMGKRLVVVRKRNESSHSREKIEGELLDGAKFIILDDLVDSGTTLINILEAIDAHSSRV